MGQTRQGHKSVGASSWVTGKSDRWVRGTFKIQPAILRMDEHMVPQNHLLIYFLIQFALYNTKPTRFAFFIFHYAIWPRKKKRNFVSN